MIRWLAVLASTVAPALDPSPVAPVHGGVYPNPGWPPPPAVIPPGTTAGPGPKGPPSDAPSGRPATPTLPGPSSGAPGGPRTGGALAGPRTGVTLDDRGEWGFWWERNKYDFLVPRRAPLPRTLGDGDGTGAADDRRRELVRRLEALARHADANVRASSSIGLARLAPADHLDVLVAALRDPHFQVREAGLLGLGASGRPEAIVRLSRVAWDTEEGRRAFGSASPVPLHDRSLALAALGLVSARGESPRATDLARAWLRDGARPQRAETAAAASIALTLGGDAGAVPDLVQVARDPAEAPAARARALTALSAIGDRGGAETAERALGDRDPEVRRAAAVAWAGLNAREDARAADRLAGFLRTEEDPVCRGFALISLGRIGGARARDELRRAQASGPRASRSWAALGLGIAARGAASEAERAVLRDAFAAERSPERRGALAIALGLAGASAADAEIARGFRTETDPGLRGHLAHALALLGTDAARDALLEGVGRESNAVVRASACFALGVLGDPRDLEPLVEALRTNRVGPLMGPFSLALAFHGGEGAFEALLGVIDDRSAPESGRAGAIDAAVLLLERSPLPILHRVARESNYLADAAVTVSMLEFLL